MSIIGIFPTKYLFDKLSNKCYNTVSKEGVYYKKRLFIIFSST
jgi:hypothetical protein